MTGNVLPSEVNEQTLASMMIGREVMLQADKEVLEPKETVLSIKNLRVKDRDGVERVKGVSFDIKAGQIVGIAGVAGSGQQQLVSALFGMAKPEPGSVIEFCGEDITFATPREHRVKGIGYAVFTRPYHKRLYSKSYTQYFPSWTYRARSIRRGQRSGRL